jgi:predicted nuclease of predicted toxin-antitoxin system
VRFLLDEDVPSDIRRALRNAGHTVEIAFEVVGESMPDEAVWAHAVATKAIVVTCNRQHFLGLAGTNPATGLIVLGRKDKRQTEVSNILKLLKKAGPSGLEGNINFA